MERLSENFNKYSLDNFWEYGVAAVQNFFSESELDNYLVVAKTNWRATESPNDNYELVTTALLKDERSLEVLLSKKIIEVAHKILDSRPVFFGHALAWYKPPLIDREPVALDDIPSLEKILPPYDSKAHIDAKGSEENLFSVRHDLHERYPVIRFGWFQQSFLNKSFGLRVYPRSHHRGKVVPGTLPLYLDCGARDLLIFSLKTVHSALSLNPSLSSTENPGIQNLSPEEEIISRKTSPSNFYGSPNSRNVVFYDFSDNSRLSELFIRNRAVANTDVSYGRIYKTNLTLSPFVNQLISEGLIVLREDLRLLSSMKWADGSDWCPEQLIRLKRDVNKLSSFPIEHDLSKPRAMQLSKAEI